MGHVIVDDYQIFSKGYLRYLALGLTLLVSQCAYLFFGNVSLSKWPSLWLIAWFTSTRGIVMTSWPWKRRRPQKEWRWPQKGDDLKNEDDIKNEDNLKNGDDLKMKMTKWRWPQKWRLHLRWRWPQNKGNLKNDDDLNMKPT